MKLVMLLFLLFPMLAWGLEVVSPDPGSPILYYEVIIGEVKEDGAVLEVSRERIAPEDYDGSSLEFGTSPALPNDKTPIQEVFQANDSYPPDGELFNKARIGTENRFIVNANNYPYKAVARLSFKKYGKSGTYSCTGWRAGKRVMMTNGHCVYDRDGKKFHHTNRADFGYRDGSYKQREYPMLIFVSKWYQEKKSGVDWGGYILRRNAPNYTGWFGTKGYSSSWNNNNYWFVSGYGSNYTGKPFSTQFQTRNGPACKVASIRYSGRALFHNCDTGQGSSGSPIYSYWSGLPYAVGVNYGGWGPRGSSRMSSCSPFKWGVCGNMATRQQVFLDTLKKYLSTYK